MQFENGNLILDDAERSLLSAVSMKEIKVEYPAAYFVGSLVEMKAEAELYIRQIGLKQDQDRRDVLRIEIILLLIETLDCLAQKGYEAAEVAGNPIRWQ
ncbi:hypothetical protein GALL_89860 [mine drainage metagenome]|uniref:Uncharacterized protein n=1 Tax=mine drainage metagenome TaxID=410659 RepID=A0A1J5SKM4_9ZZZZ